MAVGVIAGGQQHLQTVERRIASLVKSGWIKIIKPDDLANQGYKHRTPGNTYLVLKRR